jgi:single-stranded-DNA-specific exonuclease
MNTLPGRRIRQRPADGAENLTSESSPLLRQIYAARGVYANAQLSRELDSLLPVRSLEGAEAAARLLQAHRAGRVLVIGDFDVDGATSTALMLRALRSWGFNADFLVPDRFRFGYGLTPGIVALAAERNPTLLVTVDNGISSIEGVACARALGLQVLITDHHLPGSVIPDATVIVNPNQSGCAFASKALAGVGVAFYVLAALQKQLQAEGQWPVEAAPISQWLDLVALGTVADLVPLDANNRILVAQGLRRIRAGRCVAGIKALLAIAQRGAADIVASDLGFAVAPRLNAAGRLDDMSIGIRCLLEDDEQSVQALALQLDVLNKQRRQIEGDMQAVALAAVRGLASRPETDQRKGLCLYDVGWHQGVIGLVASRVKERVGRPVIAFAPAGEDGLLRGSARSIPGVHVRDVLEAIATRDPALLPRFGGHAMAAGLTLEHSRLDEFALAFDAEVATWLRRIAPDDVLLTDGTLQPESMDISTAQLLRNAGPWGQGFPEPAFDGEFDIESTRIVGERHVKFWLRPVDSTARFDAIAFGLLDGERTTPPSGRARLVYRLDINHYRGEQRLQLLIDHIQSRAENSLA